MIVRCLSTLPSGTVATASCINGKFYTPEFCHQNTQRTTTSFVPQLKAIADVSFLMSMVVVLHNEKIKPKVSAPNRTLLSNAMTDLLSHAIAEADYFAPAPPQNTMSTQTALRHVEVALATGDEALVENIFQRLTDVTNLSPADVESRAREVLLPLVPLVDAELKARGAHKTPVPGVKAFYEATVRLFSGTIQTGVGPMKGSLTVLVNACVIHGGVDALSNQ